ncbi:hypothetical protein [Burkholderia oklahomensis]|uniref:hypothetical protein n=1 Tax=Burkholderia oklahomensis TaxID=342113 RepID=UPI00016A7C9F|nr:hypothetical protein [Burkholderia oklahomensis]AJX36109.1 putative transmembrane protein [Burkholderia oklahomensis C6786]AOI49285.1 secretion protein [Burkholderia oklahomensis C6786]KUY60668.1 secretion protein [Burkholderia oklahomensis C6786]MBI0362470.1 secretion protein [Burkholderia oklahomensis]SUY26577.1 type III secretion apparatus protein, YscD/HrpQ family [Burkholderia oklahomensis]
MKLLRILTGVHAGAQLQLAPGTHRIGSDDDAHIRLTDWHAPDLLMHVEDDVVRARLVATDIESATPAEDSPELISFVDFVPMQFDGTVLCVGPDTAAWPSDFDLLSMLLVQRATRPVWRHRYARPVAACLVLGSITLALTALSTSQISRAAPPPNAGNRVQRVVEALAAAHIDGLHVRPVGDTVVVTGMIARAADADAVRTLLTRITTPGIVSRYDIAPQVSRSIEESLGVPGARVEYSGGGRFVVKGSAGSREALESAVERIRADLDPNVTEVSIVASEPAASTVGAGPTSYAEMISAGNVQYAQTPDGVKHVYAADAPADSGDGAVKHSEAPAMTSDVPPLPPNMPG